MGFSWSLFFAQSAHETIVEEQAVLIGLKSDGMTHLQYVDSFAALGKLFVNKVPLACAECASSCLCLPCFLHCS